AEAAEDRDRHRQAGARRTEGRGGGGEGGGRLNRLAWGDRASEEAKGRRIAPPLLLAALCRKLDVDEAGRPQRFGERRVRQDVDPRQALDGEAAQLGEQARARI